MATPLDVYRCDLSGIRLVEASAGTGKTWAICGLYLRLLLEQNQPVERILVVSFTKAATAELRERIRARIAEVLATLEGRAPPAQDPFATNLLAVLRDQGIPELAIRARLDRALQTFDEAAIFTIHGFCKRALDDTPFATGMPLALEQIPRDAEFVQEVAEDFWRRHLIGTTPAAGLMRALALHKDTPEKLGELLRRRVAKPLAQLLWPADLDPPVTIDEAALQATFADARALWQAEREDILSLVFEAQPGLNKSHFKTEAIEESARSWDTLSACLEAADVPPTLPKLDLLTTARLKPNKGAKPVKGHRFFDVAATLCAQLAILDAEGERARLRLLRTLLAEAPDQLAVLKQQRRVISFDDLLSSLRNRLMDRLHPVLAPTLRERFPVALIDEFQDTDPLQFDIFREIYSTEGMSLFLVGDPKQAIYKFRNADLRVYLQARDVAREIYTLTENQRSTKPVLTAVNALFGTNPGAFMIPEMEYRDLNLGLRPRRELEDSTAGTDAALRLWRLPDVADGGLARASDARPRIAAATAGEIARLLAAAARGEVRLGSRALSAGDIAVLVPTHALGRKVRDALAGLGVGSVELSQESIFASCEAEELERVLRAVREPGRPGLLKAALATQLMGDDASAIEALADDGRRATALLERFVTYRTSWLERGVGVMLQQLITGEGVARRLLALPFGERRLTNLLHLAELLQAAVVDNPGVDGLLRWLEEARRDPEQADETQLRLESDRHLVQIVTLHSSKGLEYPIVFCPFLWDSFLDTSQTQDGVEYHDDAGRLVVDFTDAASKREEVKARRIRERAEERLRLIYVAMTRAVNRCYLVVGPYIKGKSDKECAKAALNWLVAGAQLTPEEWLKGALSATDITPAWSAWAEGKAQASLESLPTGPFAALPPEPVVANSIVARSPPAWIPPGWRIGSYSGLIRGAAHDDTPNDHDLHVEDPSTEEAATPFIAEGDDILNFPAGANAGECIHAVLEHIDFTDPTTWPGAIESALQLKPQQKVGASGPLPLSRMLHRMVSDVVATELPGGLRLADVPFDRRLVELRFTMPAGEIRDNVLGDHLRQHGYGGPRLTFESLQGYLGGAIDLVCEYGGRYWVIDWKSNWLGMNPDDYAPEPVLAALDHHGYHLQYLLYSVAVHRHLKACIPGYRYEQHFGGVHYLFVRGVRPAWRNDDGSARGVYAHRPSEALIEALSSLLSTTGSNA